MFLDVTRSLLGCYRFAVALRALVALAPGLRLDLFSYLDKRHSLGRRHFYFYSNRTHLTKIKTPISERIWYNRPVPETGGKFCRRKHS